MEPDTKVRLAQLLDCLVVAYDVIVVNRKRDQYVGEVLRQNGFFNARPEKPPQPEAPVSKPLSPKQRLKAAKQAEDLEAGERHFAISITVQLWDLPDFVPLWFVLSMLKFAEDARWEDGFPLGDGELWATYWRTCLEEGPQESELEEWIAELRRALDDPERQEALEAIDPGVMIPVPRFGFRVDSHGRNWSPHR